MFLENSTLKKFIGNTSWMLFQNIYSMLVSLVVGSLSARFLGPSNYGLLSYGSSIISFFLIVSKLGMGSFVVPEMVRTPEKEASYMGTAICMRFITSFLSFFSIWGIIVILEPGNKLLHTVTALQALAVIFQSTEVFYYWFQAKMEMKYVTITSMVALTVTSVWRITLLATSADIIWFALSASLSALVCGIMILFFFFKRARLKMEVHYDDALFIIKNSYHFMINSLAITFYTQVDRIMLGKLIDERSVGYYSAAGTIAVMWEFIPNAIIDSARPLLVKLYDSNKEEFIKRYQILLLGITGIGMGVGFIFTIFSKLFIWILYGKEYYEAIPALSILIWSTSLAMIGSARSIWIVLVRKSEYMKYFTLMGAGINIVLNAIMIPAFGIIGASFATLITQCFVGVLAPIFFKDTREFAKIYFASFKNIPSLIVYLKEIVRRH